MNQASDNRGRVTLRGIRKSFGSFEALKGVDLDIEAVEFFALLGPSGSGKTTTLRVLAGLETPDEGVMTLDDADVTYAQPGERDVAMVFQNYALYPHMTLEANIGFPLKMDGVPKDQIPGLVREAAAKVKIDHLLHRRPGQLSGGQQQRCALARAIVRQPRLFLLDEPLSNLDAQLRLETRVELKKLQRSLDVTTVYVTHDQEEAMTIADRMAVFLDGNIAQVGTPEEVFNTPRNVDVAAFIGSPPMNILKGHLDGTKVSIGDYAFNLPAAVARSPGEVVVGIRPSHIAIAQEGLPASLYLSENLGESMLLNFDVGDQLVKVRLPEVCRFADNETVRLKFDPGHVHLFDPQSGTRID
ncbi:ABC transporter ATP-binding protein [Pelagibius sp. Alg239-R121]|uniref:ABC transporter ATP-binding protein n=1 Tax=Pelagibius sp. Alg239-R121 TaxID=2993448 RepID=UPI0024A71E9B|nr:ABC transporter ATP-binding protein [Pelagibius sp. Alg239-R121]